MLWSCATCGACVQQCPVDIEHVDHIIDMRRYQVLVESNFPAELNRLFKGMENKGNPWNMSPNVRMDWAKGLDFEVKVVGEDLESLDEVDWLFWVGCAGAYEDRAKKTTRAVAELLDIAGVSFGVLGNGETCTGDSARRAGNEFVFQGLAQQNVETFKEYKVKKVVSTCAHCFNTLKNEYQEFGIELEVVHHTQLLNRLVREGKLTPVEDGAGAAKRSITYHDPCYIGRHNQVYAPPRELLQVLPGAEFVEMERNSERSFCCGAGGARMWMEETIGERINVNRTNEAVGTGADQIAVGCPFCRVMLSDGLTAMQAAGDAREEVEVLDVAQMLLASVKGEPATAKKAAPPPRPAGSSSSEDAGGGTATATLTRDDDATKAEPEAGDATKTEDTITETADAGPAAKASGGSSLFDLATTRGRARAREGRPRGDRPLRRLPVRPRRRRACGARPLRWLPVRPGRRRARHSGARHREEAGGRPRRRLPVRRRGTASPPPRRLRSEERQRRASKPRKPKHPRTHVLPQPARRSRQPVPSSTSRARPSPPPRRLRSEERQRRASKPRKPKRPRHPRPPPSPARRSRQPGPSSTSPHPSSPRPRPRRRRAPSRSRPTSTRSNQSPGPRTPPPRRPASPTPPP